MLGVRAIPAGSVDPPPSCFRFGHTVRDSGGIKLGKTEGAQPKMVRRSSLAMKNMNAALASKMVLRPSGAALMQSQEIPPTRPGRTVGKMEARSAEWAENPHSKFAVPANCWLQAASQRAERHNEVAVVSSAANCSAIREAGNSYGNSAKVALIRTLPGSNANARS